MCHASRPAACWGPEPHQHKKGCRPGRPLCRWRRQERGICSCPAYHYPHRPGAGRCGDAEKMAAWAHGPVTEWCDNEPRFDAAEGW